MDFNDINFGFGDGKYYHGDILIFCKTHYHFGVLLRSFDKATGKKIGNG